MSEYVLAYKVRRLVSLLEWKASGVIPASLTVDIIDDEIAELSEYLATQDLGELDPELLEQLFKAWNINA